MAHELDLEPAELAYVDGYGARGDNELEARFGAFHASDDAASRRGGGRRSPRRSAKRGGGSRFVPGVSARVFKALAHHLETSAQFQPVTGAQTMVKLALDGSATGIQITGEAAARAYAKDPAAFDATAHASRFFTKAKGASHDNRNYGYRLAAATEAEASPTPQEAAALMKRKAALRTLLRSSFTSADGALRFDLSITRQGRPGDALARVLKAEPTYEVEVEYVGAPGGQRALYRGVFMVLEFVQGTPFPVGAREVERVSKEYAAAFRTPRFLAANPVTCMLQHLLPSDVHTGAPSIRDGYTVVDKSDGERRLLFTCPTGGVYLLGSVRGPHGGLTVTRTGLRGARPATLLDGEWLRESNLFLAFDMLFEAGEDVRDLPLRRTPDQIRGRLPKGRWERAVDAVSGGEYSELLPGALHVRVKELVAAPDLLARAGHMWKERERLYKHRIDGLTFTPLADPYPRVEKGQSAWSGTLKWKPRGLLSIDLLVQLREGEKVSLGDRGLVPYRVATLLASDRGRHVPFAPVTDVDYRPGTPPYLARLPVDEKGRLVARDPLSGRSQPYKDGAVVEFCYNAAARPGFEWEAIRVRHDKTDPNALATTATQNWLALHQGHGLGSDPRVFEVLTTAEGDRQLRAEWAALPRAYYANPQTQEQRQQAHDFSLRSRHNAIKRRLLEAMAASLAARGRAFELLLDLGAGRGGDVRKWADVGVRRVYAVDRDAEGLRELAARAHGQDVVPVVGDMTGLLSAACPELAAVYERQGHGCFQGVSAMFSAHYAFGSERALRGLLANVAQALEQDGLFVGTCMDGRAVMDALRDRRRLEFATADDQMLAAIDKRYDGDGELAPWGQGVDVTVSSINGGPGGGAYRESLVNFEELTRLLGQDYGLVPIDAEEARALGLPAASALFGELPDGAKLSPGEAAFSGLNRFFVFKRVGAGRSAVQAKWLAALSR